MFDPATDPFDALSDPTRRRILQMLSREEQPVAALAKHLPVSQMTVSRHLQILKRAGFVKECASGHPRPYQLCDEGLDVVTAFLASVWGEVSA